MRSEELKTGQLSAVYFIALAAVIGLLAAACSVKKESGETAPFLNGTWVAEEDGVKLILDNGSLTVILDTGEGVKGTYSVSGSDFTMTIAQVNLWEDASSMGLSATEWYTQSEIRTAVIQSLINDGMTKKDAEAAYNRETATDIDEMFARHTGSYKLNTLSLTFDEETLTYTRERQTENGKAAPSFNGTWVDIEEEGDKLILDNGSFTLLDDRGPGLRGTYSVSGSDLTMTVTQVSGAWLGERAISSIGLSSTELYTQSELRLTFLLALVSTGMTRASAEALYNREAAPLFDEVFAQYTGTLIGNTLFVTFAGAMTAYTRER